ncbi:hypothetical protein KD050_11810 [Psychrobacillus sp. INOP01]|uniref:hypothetical protein n=1 Tax=Psychrobacillus sp. INOP01 TaxID=2829187 RepID=UPI001BA5148F|nr:hypothetical protein [Psychrobacillus sp. INOP01]QUG40006.1 hypothetical protein KD050_11810 [Psychrobacillus sp. INOP01]
MTILSNDQIQLLNNYSVYIQPSGTTLFNGNNLASALPIIKLISSAPNDPIAASFFMRRVGMFISMQFYMMTMYDEIWDGPLEQLHFFGTTEYGNKTISTFIPQEYFRDVQENRNVDVQLIWEQQCFTIIEQLRSQCSISPLTLWENVFGYLLWHYYTFFENPALKEKARHDWNLLIDSTIWNAFASKEYLRFYLKDRNPVELINTTVRTTCCFSKDIPGLQKCSFCPQVK